MRAALRALAELSFVQIDCVSSFYETPPWGKIDQPPFLNAAACVSVLPGRQYFLPQELQKSDPLSTDFNEFYSILKQSNQSLIKALYMSFAGISPLCADEVCFRCGINGEQACAWLSEDVSRHVFNIFNILLDEIKNHNFHPAIIYKNQQPFEFASAVDRKSVV